MVSSSTVAFGCHSPATVEVWDWKEGKQLRILTGFSGSYVFGTARLPDARLVAVGSDGYIRIGTVDNWSAATVINNGAYLMGVVAAQDGSFVTADSRGETRLWRNGVCEATLKGSHAGASYGNPVSIVGCRLVTIGAGRSLLLVE